MNYFCLLLSFTESYFCRYILSSSFYYINPFITFSGGWWLILLWLCIYFISIFCTILDSLFNVILLGSYDVCSQFLDEKTKVQWDPNLHRPVSDLVGSLKSQVCLDGLPSLLAMWPVTICLTFCKLHLSHLQNGINIFILLVVV